MPLATIHVLEGRYDERRLSNVSKAVQDALISILKIPSDDFFQIIQSELGRLDTTMSECKDLYFDQARVIEEVLKEGIREGAVRTLNTRKAAFAVADLTKGIVIQRTLGWSRTRLKDEVEFIFNLLWKGIAK